MSGARVTIPARVTSIALTTYEFSLFLHITAVVVGLGATFAEAIAFPLAMKTGTRHLPYVHRLQLAINQRFVNPALLVVLLTGIYQVSDADFIDFSDFWISASFVIVLVIGAINGAYFIPTDRKLAAQVERELDAAGGDGEAALSEEYRAATRTEGVVGMVMGLLVVIAIFLMIDKPGA
jgi:uncharacterized membrane protein